MSDSTVAITAGSGTPIDVSSVTTGSGTVNRQRIVIGDDTGADGLAAVSNGSLQVFVPDITAAINITTSTGTQSIALNGRQSAAFVLTSVGTGGTVVVEGSVDGTNWVLLDVYAEAVETWVTGSITTTGSWWVEPLGAMNSVRVRATALTSGSITGTWLVSMGTMHTPEYVGGLGVTAPPNAAFLGGTDGTNLRGMAVNTTGHVKTALTPLAGNGIALTGTMSGSVSASAKGAVKTTAGTVYGIVVGNSNTSAAYFVMFNATTAGVTLGTTTPDLAFFVPAGGGLVMMFDTGISFGTAITVSATTTRSGSTGPTNALDYNVIYI